MFDNFSDVLTPEEAAEALRIGMNAIYDNLRSGKLKAFRNGRTWRIPKTALTEYILNESKSLMT